MTHCDLCNQPDCHFYQNKRMCAYHYWIARGSKPENCCKKKVDLMHKCTICGDIAKTEKHHVNYFPEQIQQICYHCHMLIHKGKKYPESQTFYKGVVE